jgi:hypothetical protein
MSRKPQNEFFSARKQIFRQKKAKKKAKKGQKKPFSTKS